MQSRKIIYRLLGLCLTAGLLPTANASFIIEIDTDGLDNGVLTYNTNFSFGGDTTTASQSAATSALGMTGGDSIFGGDGVNLPDTYVYTYDLDVDGDNLALTAGAALNGSGNTASGEVAGGTGSYNVYAAWPFTTNVSGGPTTFVLTDDLNTTLFNISLDQNNLGHEWVFLDNATLDSSRTYTLTQSSTTNTFVSMRAGGVMFDITSVPVPPAVALMGSGILALYLAGRKRKIYGAK